MILKSKILLALLLTVQCIHGQEFTIYSAAEKSEKNASFQIQKDSVGVPYMLQVQADGQESPTEFALQIFTIGGVEHTGLQSARARDQILSMLNCSESEFNKTFRPVTSGLVTLLDTLTRGESAAANIQVQPSPSTESSGLPWLGWLIGGVVGLAAGLLIRGTRRSTPSASTLSIDDEVWDDHNTQDWMNFLSDLMGIDQSDLDEAGSMQQAVRQKYTALQIDVQQPQSQSSTASSEDATYFRNLEKIYMERLQNYFSRNKFENDMDPQKKVLENLLPLALHYESYIKIRQKNAQDYDKLNYKNIKDGGGELNTLSKVTFKSNFRDNTPYVASIIAIMEHYGIDKLSEVNLYNQRIEK